MFSFDGLILYVGQWDKSCRSIRELFWQIHSERRSLIYISITSSYCPCLILSFYNLTHASNHHWATNFFHFYLCSTDLIPSYYSFFSNESNHHSSINLLFFHCIPLIWSFHFTLFPMQQNRHSSIKLFSIIWLSFDPFILHLVPWA